MALSKFDYYYYNCHFRGKPGLAGCPVDFPNKVFSAKYYTQIPFLSPTSRNTLGFSFLCSLWLLKGKRHHCLLHRLSDANTPVNWFIIDVKN